MPPKIRPAEHSDLASIVAMAKALTDTENRLPDAEAPTVCALTEEILERHCFGAEPLVHALVAEDSDGLVGYLTYTRSFDCDSASVGLWMGDLYVAPATRRRGVGRALLRALAAACREHEATWIAWQVKRQNAVAQAFYDRYGAVDPDLSYWCDLEELERRLA